MRANRRKHLKNKRKFNRVLFLAPIAVALALLFLYSQNQQAFAAAWRSPLDLLSDRSPGHRDAGALYNTKPEHRIKPGHRVRAGRPVPQERVLAMTRERGLPIAAPFSPEGLPFELVPDAMPLGEAFGVPQLTPAGLSGTPGFGGGGGGGGGAPGLNFLPGLDTPQDDGPATPEIPDVAGTPQLIPPPIIDTPQPGCCGGETPVAPVPEPSTWVMMILGFGLVGRAMRSPRPGTETGLVPPGTIEPRGAACKSQSC